MAHISKVRDYSREHDYDASAVVRVQNSILADLGGRNAWVKLAGPNNTIFRRARGAGGAAGLPSDAIELDYDSRLELDLVRSPPDTEHFYSCDLEILRASARERFLAHWSHPNLEYRAPYQISIVGAGLGVVGLILGIISLIK